MKQLIEHDGNGRLLLNFHPGQSRAWVSRKRIVAVLAGTQGGKTSFGPLWFQNEIAATGPGDYMIVTPTFSLLELKALPEFRSYFEDRLDLGRYIASPVRRFQFSRAGQTRLFGDYGRDYKTNVFFGYAADPDSLESATAKAAWLDEAGQKKFKQSSFEAILRRLSLARGRVLLTTTIYNLGWIKRLLYDPWLKSDRVHPDIDVISFPSTMNPRFSREEDEAARARLPLWKYRMFYRGVFTKPAGLIYDCFDEDRHVCGRFEIPADWPRYLGVDFGGVNTAAVFYACNPETAVHYIYKIYHEGGRTATEHARALQRDEPGFERVVGGSKSEGQWRMEFRAGGLDVREPGIGDVEVGIDRVYAGHKQDKIVVFDDLHEYLDEKMNYSRELDELGEPTEKIENKNAFHLMDAERYIGTYLFGAVGSAESEIVDPEDPLENLSHV